MRPMYRALFSLSIVIFAPPVLAASACDEFIGRWQCTTSMKQTFIEDISIEGRVLKITTNPGTDKEKQELKWLTAEPRENSMGGFPLSLHTMLLDYISAKIPAVAAAVAFSGINNTKMKIDKIETKSADACVEGRLQGKSNFNAVVSVTSLVKVDVKGETDSVQHLVSGQRTIDEVYSGALALRSKFSIVKSGDWTPFSFKATTNCVKVN